MKRSIILAIIVALVTMLAAVMPAMAQGPPGTTVTVSWYEDAVRYYPDGTVKQSWVDDGPYSADLICVGKTYRFADIQEYYNAALPDLEGMLVISGAGILSGHATYTLYGLPTRNLFHGQVTIDADAGTMVGTYTQWKSVFGPRDDVLSHYDKAVPANKQGSGWWFVSYTVYTAHQ